MRSLMVGARAPSAFHKPAINDERGHTARSRFWSWFLLATAILVVLYPAFSIWIPYHREREIVQKIQGWGGLVGTTTGGPEWLRQLVGDEPMKVFDRVANVDLHDSSIDDADLTHLKGLTNIQFLNLAHTDVTDSGLAHLSGMTKLERLSIRGTQVSDAGLAHLSSLKNLTQLYLRETQVSDSRIPQLSKLTNLRWLDLRETQFTDGGVEALQKALPDCQIGH